MGTQHTVDIKTLSAEINLPDRTIRTLMRRRKIPYIKVGHRTLRFQPEKVKTALERLTVKEVGA